MTNNKPNEVRVSHELLVRAANSIENHHNSIAWEIASELRAILAQPADQQGEPFAWMCLDFEGGYDFTEDAERAERWRKSLGEKYKDCLTPLYRHAQPATAKVILPERLDIPHCDEFESSDQHAAAVGEANAYNACLDEVARLNTPQ